MKRVITLLTILVGLVLPTRGDQPAIEWDGTRADLFSDDDGPFTLGFQFLVNSDITVTSLGAFDYLGDGFATAHTVGIWNLSGGAPLAMVTLLASTSASLLGSFRYGSVASVTLFAGTEYLIGASDYYGSINDIYAHSVPLAAVSIAQSLFPSESSEKFLVTTPAFRWKCSAASMRQIPFSL